MGKRSYVKLHGKAVAERDWGWYCYYCGIPLRRMNIRKLARLKKLREDGYGAATIDHLKPLSKGGSRKRSNMVLCCWDCNERKGDSDANSFIRSLKFEDYIKNCNGTHQPRWHRG